MLNVPIKEKDSLFTLLTYIFHFFNSFMVKYVKIFVAIENEVFYAVIL